MCDHDGTPLHALVTRLTAPTCDQDVRLRAGALGIDADALAGLRRSVLGTDRPSDGPDEAAALCAALDATEPAIPDVATVPWSVQTVMAVDVAHAAASTGLDLPGLRAHLSQHAPHDLALAVLLLGAESRWHDQTLPPPEPCACPAAQDQLAA